MIRVVTNDQKPKNLDFIFTGGNSEVICIKIKGILQGSNMNESELRQQSLDQEILLKLDILAHKPHLKDLFDE